MFNSLLAIVLLGTTPTFTPSEASFIEVMRERCPTGGKIVTPQFLRALLDAETKADIPEYARGISIVAACRESGFNPHPKHGDGGKAVGLLQWWPWWENAYRFNRETQPLVGVFATMHHVTTLTKKVRRHCGKVKRPFFYAYTWVTSGPKGHKCRHNRHIRTLLHWKWRSRLAMRATSADGP